MSNLWKEMLALLAICFILLHANEKNILRGIVVESCGDATQLYKSNCCGEIEKQT